MSLNEAGLAIGDYDNDGYLDICSGGYTGNTRLYKNNGNGSFTRTNTNIGTSYRNYPAFGDYDNDGNLDLVFANGISRNNGAGTFADAVTLNNGVGGIDKPAVADMNSDGRLDVVTLACLDDSTYFLRINTNNGNNTFTRTDTSPQLVVPDYPNVALADLDNDGGPDIVAEGFDQIVSKTFVKVFMNRNSSMGNANTAPQPPTGLTALFSYDVNVASITLCWTPAQYDVGNSSHSIYYNIEMATYPVTLSTDRKGIAGVNSLKMPWNYGASDFGKFMRPAIKTWPGLPQPMQGAAYQVSLAQLVSNATYYYRVQTIDAGLMRSTWSAEFSICTPAPQAPNMPTGLTQYIVAGSTLASYDWAGKAGDVVASSFTLTDPDGGQLVKFRIQISSVTYLNSPLWNQGLSVDYTSNWLTQGSTNFYWPALPNAGRYWWRVYALNQSSVPALATLLGDGTSPVISWKTDFDPKGVDIVPGIGITGIVALGDVDNNGTLDLAIVGNTGSGSIDRVYKNNGDGTFNQSFTTLVSGSGIGAGKFVMGDYNNDGYLDVAVGGNDLSIGSQRLYVLRNNGDGTFNSTKVQPIPGWLPGGAPVTSWADYNNDGYLDLGISCNDGSIKNEIFYNLGNGAFNPTPAVFDTVGMGAITSADYDNDGNIDVCITINFNATRIFKNNGNGTFTKTFDQSWARNAGGVFGDYDNDGKLDLALWNNVRNNNSSFATSVTLGHGHDSAAWADINNDGLLDLVANGSIDGTPNTKYLDFFRNNGNNTFTANEIRPNWGINNDTNLSAPALALGDIDNNGDVDCVVIGRDTAGTRTLRAFFNKNHDIGNANVAPVPPSGLASQTTYAVANSTVIITWPTAQYDAGKSSCTLYFQVAVSTAPMALGASNKALIESPAAVGSYITTWASQGDGFGNFLRPSAKVWGTDSTTNFGYQLNLSTNSISANTTYYYRVQTIDASLARSTWSAEYTYFTNAPPAVVTDLYATAGGIGSGAVTLTWTAPGDAAQIGNLTAGSQFKIEYSSVGIINQADFDVPPASLAVQTITISTDTTAMSPQSYNVTGLMGSTTYWFALQTQNAEGIWSIWQSSVDVAAYNNFASTCTNALDATPPAALTDLAAVTGFGPGTINLSWTSPGDDGLTGDIAAGAYKIRYSTYTTEAADFWTDAATNWTDFSNKYQVAWSTDTAPSLPSAHALTGLTEGVTYYIRAWTRDEIGTDVATWNGNWSELSNGATCWAQTTNMLVVIDSAAATINFGNLAVGSSAITLSSATIYNLGNVTATFKMYVSTETPGTPWTVAASSGPDSCIIWGLLNSARPTDGDFGDEDKLFSTYTVFTSTYIAGDQNGVSVPPGESRIFWYKIQMPTVSNTDQPQAIRFKVNGE
jgi:hypothetical protein